ncbi:MAG: TlyA family RNA methyltransferase [Actinomycetota bacterium]|nr:TlyA family RNA methyltransferase [Actinomycetota bacterium]
MAKIRADVYLVDIGIASSREQARRLIIQGRVFANGKPIGKPASLIDQHSHITVLEETSYVSRGGLKLEKALHAFGINPKGKIAIDVGASTGGFTDCLLRHGAEKVIAIDVGYGQLAWTLRQNPKVEVMEKTNIRYVKPEDISSLADIITIDVSFISLEKIHDSVVQLLKPGGKIIALVKPQFEAGRERVGKKGVVKDASTHRDVLSRLWDFYHDKGMFIKGLTYSPIKGPEGNIEFLFYISPEDAGMPADIKLQIIDEVVEAAHKELD